MKHLIKIRLFVMVMIVFFSFSITSCGRNNPPHKITDMIENMTRINVASIGCMFDFVDEAIDDLDGNGMLPYEIKNQLEEYFLCIEDVNKKMIEDTTLSGIKGFGMDAIYADNLKIKFSQTKVAIGDMTPVQVSGNKKMWTFTEIFSGYQYNVVWDKEDDDVHLTMTPESSEKFNYELKKKITQFENACDAEIEDPVHVYTDEDGFIYEL